MHLEHLNLVVKNMAESLHFYKAAFPNWSVRCKGESLWYGTQRNWLHFGDEYNYLSLNDNGLGENRNLQSNDMGLSHFAYVTNNIEAAIKRLVDAGYPVAKQGADEPHRRNVYFFDPDGYEVEFVEYLSDIPHERNLTA